MTCEWLLVSDVDDTLLGDTHALDRLRQRVAATGMVLVLNSSRPVESVRSSLERCALSVRAVVGALGTQIAWDGVRDRVWEARFDGFPRSRISSALAGFGDAHDDSLQALAKVSHAVPSHDWGRARQVVRRIDPSVRVLTSSRSNLDVIPGSAGKAAVLRYVAQRCGVPWHRVLTAGDAEIDAEMLTSAMGIAVGNSTQELRRLVRGRAYLAARSHAAGILEGLDHFGAPAEGRRHG